MMEIPPEIARAFVQAMNDYFAEPNPTKQDAIAVHMLHVLRDYQPPREKKIGLSDVKRMFRKMRRKV